ncbi:PP2C family protein-serine/threonine phosphatase [Streptomyces sp. NPDC003710]
MAARRPPHPAQPGGSGLLLVHQLADTARAVARLLPGPDAVVQAINKALPDRPNSHGTGFVTLVYGHLTPAPAGTSTSPSYAPATPCPSTFAAAAPLAPSSARVRSSASPHTLTWRPTAHPHLETHRLHLQPTESLLLYTDGLTEARNQHGERFGEDRLTHTPATQCDTGPEAIINALTWAVHAFTGTTGMDDDQAALVLTATSAVQKASAGV